MTDIYLVTLIAAPSLEENLVDWLLSHESRREADCGSCETEPAGSAKCCHGFTSFAVSGHSSRHQGLSLEEQVAGRKKQVGFEMHIRGPDLAALLAGLKQDFAGTGLHYWVTPVLDSGTL